jgi:hypothetical protein
MDKIKEKFDTLFGELGVMAGIRRSSLQDPRHHGDFREVGFETELNNCPLRMRSSL